MVKCSLVQFSVIFACTAITEFQFCSLQFYCINTTAAGVAATAGFTEICLQSSEALTGSQPGGVYDWLNVHFIQILTIIKIWF